MSAEAFVDLAALLKAGQATQSRWLSRNTERRFARRVIDSGLTRRDLIKVAGVAAVGVSAAALSARVAEGQAASDAATSSESMRRAEELLRQMTVEEKAMQLSCVVPLALLDRDGLMPRQSDALIKQGIGHVAGIGMLGHKAPETIAKSVNAIQRYSSPRRG
jgi:hypothetical protein